MRTEYWKDTEVAAYLGISRPSVWRYTKLGLLPKPVKIGQRSTRWASHKVKETVEAQQEAAA